MAHIAPIYRVTPEFSTVPTPQDGMGRECRVGVLTDCTLTPVAGEAEAALDLNLGLAITDNGYRMHSGMLQENGQDPLDPRAGVVEFEGTKFGVGGNFEWEPTLGVHGLLKVYVHVTQRRMPWQHRQPETATRLGNVMTLAVGRAIADEVGAGTDIMLWPRISGSTTQEDPRLSQPTLVEHTYDLARLARVRINRPEAA